jgi:branched-chain amino acid transport system ATP-binding protein
MLELKCISTGYESTNVIHSIDLTVAPGEIVALVGANGAGKSTLVKTIAGLLALRDGEIVLDTKRIDKLNSRARVLAGVSMVPEGRQVFGGLTVIENLRLGAYARRGEINKAQLARRIDRVCERFPILGQRLHESAGNLSGGQQQMLAIARGLMAEPRILVLDEPSLGLAPVLVTEIFHLVAGLRSEGRAILLSEQNARLSLAIADRGYVLENGRVTLVGTGNELLRNPEIAARYLGVGKGVNVANTARRQQMVTRLKKIFAH